jgi:hypothetical protein
MCKRFVTPAGVAQVQIALELRLGEADIDAVDLVQNIADEDKGDDPIDHLPVETMFVAPRNR